MVRISWSLPMIGIGLLTVIGTLGLSSMSARAQDPYPPVCPCAVTVSIDEATLSAGDCVPVICKATENGNPKVDLECTMSVISQPGTDASVTPASAMTDANGEATAELCVGSTAGQVVVLGQTECCGSEGQIEVTVPAPAVVLPEAAEPVAAPATGGGTSSGGSSPAWLIAMCSGIALAGMSLVVWRIGSRRRSNS